MKILTTLLLCLYSITGMGQITSKTLLDSLAKVRVENTTKFTTLSNQIKVLISENKNRDSRISILESNDTIRFDASQFLIVNNTVTLKNISGIPIDISKWKDSVNNVLTINDGIVRTLTANGQTFNSRLASVETGIGQLQLANTSILNRLTSIETQNTSSSITLQDLSTKVEIIKLTIPKGVQLSY